MRSGRFRPMFKWFFWAFVVNIVILTMVGLQNADKNFVFFGLELPVTTGLVGLLSTGYYFAYFVIVLPFLPMFEKTKTLPHSIAEPVLRDGAEA